MDMQRKKPQVSNGRPSTAEAASYPHYLGRGRHKSLQRGNMSGKTSSPQGSLSPAHSQACSFSSNKASPLSKSTQHSCQDHNLKSICCGILEHHVDPSASPLSRAHAGHAIQHPWAAEAVICFAEVQKDHAAGLTCLLQVLRSTWIHLLQVA